MSLIFYSLVPLLLLFLTANGYFLVIYVTKSISKLNRKTLEDENWLLANTLRQRRETEKKEIHVVKLRGKGKISIACT